MRTGKAAPPSEVARRHPPPGSRRLRCRLARHPLPQGERAKTACLPSTPSRFAEGTSLVGHWFLPQAGTLIRHFCPFDLRELQEVAPPAVPVERGRGRRQFLGPRSVLAESPIT